jgi:hypothetical protein
MHFDIADNDIKSIPTEVGSLKNMLSLKLGELNASLHFPHLDEEFHLANIQTLL